MESDAVRALGTFMSSALISCTKSSCYGTMREKEDSLGRYLECSQCHVKTLVPSDGGSRATTPYESPERPRASRETRVFDEDDRSLPRVGGTALQKMAVRKTQAASAGAGKRRPGRPSKPKSASTADLLMRVNAGEQSVAEMQKWANEIERVTAVWKASEVSFNTALDDITQMVEIIKSEMERAGARFKRVRARVTAGEVESDSGEDARARVRATVENREKKQKRSYPVCSRCGTQFTNPSQYRGSYKRHELPVCLDTAGCAARVTDGMKRGRINADT